MKKSIVDLTSRDVRMRRRGVVKIKKQRKLFEFDIPTTNTLRVRQRSFEEVTSNRDDPVVIEDEEDEVEEEEEEEEEEEIRCPICNVDITKFEIYQKEAHAESCLEKKQERKVKVVKRPTLPDIKILRFDSGYKVVVDGFNFEKDSGINQYFLSHFHSDHYMGLRKSWDHGTIYGSQITVDLMVSKFNMSRDLVRVLPMDRETWVTETISVILLDANHCPGATVFLFQEWDSTRQTVVKQILHTGDFRSNPDLIAKLNSICTSRINQVYLDTTYLIPGFHFPTQKSVLDVTAQFAFDLVKKGIRNYFNDSQQSIFKFVRRKESLFKCLFLVGTYTIGKEKLAIAIAQALKTKIYIPKKSSRFKIISNYTSYFPKDLITHDLQESCVHLVPLSTLRSKESIEAYFKDYSSVYDDAVGFIPTGWTYTNKYAHAPDLPTIESRIQYCRDLLKDDSKNTLELKFITRQYKQHGKYQVFRVPYSEHSSFKDLVLFGTSIPCKEILATVNLHSVERIKDMHLWFNAWRTMENES